MHGRIWNCAVGRCNAARVSPTCCTDFSRGNCWDSQESLLTHFSIHLHAQQVYSLCAQWIGSPLERPLVFDLMPLSPELTIYWQRIIKAMDALMAMESPLS